MALSLASASLGFAPAAFSAPVTPRAQVQMESAADLEALAGKLNPGKLGQLLPHSSLPGLFLTGCTSPAQSSATGTR